VSPSFEVSQTPLANSSLANSQICGNHTIEMSGVLTSAQLNQVNTPIGNNQINPIPPSFEVCQTPLANSPICGNQTIEMSGVLTSAQLNQVSI
jgi:hypothetical protein